MPEVVAGIGAAGVLTALALPALAGADTEGKVMASLANLRTLGFAHAAYAADWNGRQLTQIDDEISTYGSPNNAFATFDQVNGFPHPPITLGWGPLEGGGAIVLFAYRTNFSVANARLTEPIVFDGPNFAINGYLGSHRFANTQPLAQYLDGRFYDQVFYAPHDPVVQPLVEPLVDAPWPYVDTPPAPGIGDIPFFGSYTMSAAAMFDPAVMRAADGGPGWQDPWSLADGFRSPGLYSAQYAHLKTLMLEHHWLQSAPADPCNPGFTGGAYGDCEPYYFNHGLDSAPATLFYDGSTRLLPNLEALAADELLLQSGGPGTWNRATPYGADGYFNDLSFDTVDLSHHVLTNDGILGRDTLDPGATAAAGERIRSRTDALGRTPGRIRRGASHILDFTGLDPVGGDS